MPDEPAAPRKDSGKVFTQGTNFQLTNFTEGANFQGATFTEEADFRSATFDREANFQGATFTGEANFQGATFTEEANFQGATFTQWTDFRGVKFIQRADFPGATFTQTAAFRDATFTEWAYFRDTTFTQETDFQDTTFTEGADFINSEMKSVTIFDNASFLSTPPLFDGAKLHEGTTWFGVTWPRSPRTKDDARLTVRAYERLKLEMDKLKKHEDELKFFALELQARGVLAGKWSTFQGLAISIYGCLCDYGRSYSRPIWLLTILTILGAVPFLVHFGQPGWRGSVALSVANTFGILGLRRDFFAASVITDLPWILKLVSVIQTVAGAALFFLFGLGLRNRFRMR